MGRYSGFVAGIGFESDGDVFGFDQMGASQYITRFFVLKTGVVKPFRLITLSDFAVTYGPRGDVLTIRTERPVSETVRVTEDPVAYLGSAESDEVLGLSLKGASAYLAPDSIARLTPPHLAHVT